jgi:hypothetical protein
MFDDDDDPVEPHRFRLVSDLREKGAAVPAHAERLFFIDEPTTFADAESHDCWRQAMVEELSSIEENGTWTLVDPPEGIRLIGLKWVFKTKRDATEAVVRHKVRLVAKDTCNARGSTSTKFLPQSHALIQYESWQQWQKRRNGSCITLT